VKRVLSLILLLSLTTPLCWGEDVPDKSHTWYVQDDTNWHGDTYERKVYRVGRRILDRNGITQQIGFQIVDDKEHSINAHADIKGSVSVYKNLLRYIESDDELAGILSHEIAHLLNHDPHNTAIVATTSNLGFKGLGLLGMVAGVATLNPVMVGAGAATMRHSRDMTHVATVGYTREQEASADKLGYRLMTTAGYDPHGMISIYQKFMGDTDNLFLNDHPLTSDRIKMIEDLIAADEAQKAKLNNLVRTTPDVPKALQQPSSRPASGDMAQSASPSLTQAAAPSTQVLTPTGTSTQVVSPPATILLMTQDAKAP